MRGALTGGDIQGHMSRYAAAPFWRAHPLFLFRDFATEHSMPGFARVGVVAALMCALGACQPKHDAASGGDSAAVAGAPAAAPAAAPAIVTVHARDFAFDAPDQIAAGMTTFHLVNDGPGLHHLVLIRLDSSKTAADLQAAIKNPGPLPGWAVLSGGPNAADPKGESTATVDLAAGNYVMLCFVDTPDGVPHFARGMVRPLTVTPVTTASAAAPVADAVASLSDYSIALSRPLTAGKHTIKVEVAPGQPHELVLIQLNPGKTAKDLLAWMPKMHGSPPGHVVGGASPSVSGSPVYVSVDLAPGKYLLICFLPDPKDGKPHFMHGMMQTVDVT
jgi:uncharacterized cupredoxin-like copper-binding protein